MLELRQKSSEKKKSISLTKRVKYKESLGEFGHGISNRLEFPAHLTKTKITANQNKREIAQRGLRSNDPLFTARKTVSTILKDSVL